MDGPTSLEELYDKVKGLMPNRPKVCIGIDGMTGVGKTCLAFRLAPLLGAAVIKLDDHVDKGKGEYVPFMRCQEVTAALEAAGERVVIVDGICLRSVAERCGFAIDVHIYVKRLTKTGSWQDVYICLALDPVDQLKQREREYGAPEPWVDELIDYHAQWRPVENADAIFTTVER